MKRIWDVLAAHTPAEDWHCSCGEDLFGASRAYSWELYKAHVVDALLKHLHKVAKRKTVRQKTAVAVLDNTIGDPAKDEPFLKVQRSTEECIADADAAVAAFLAAVR